MPLEVELKFIVTDFSETREALEEAGAWVVHELAYEKNVVLDTIDGELRKEGKLLRVRKYGDAVFITIKEPVQSGPMKKRIENELKIKKTFSEAQAIFGKTGCFPVYTYEKTREIWCCSGSHVCLDTLYFGMFVEIEAQSEEKVAATAVLLGFDPADGLRESYRTLEKRYKYSNS